MKHITLAVLPLILSACSSSQPAQRIDITHGKSASVQKWFLSGWMRRSANLLLSTTQTAYAM